ncbi:dTDP-4-dehydrorhamnose 3,5-epimerase [Jinshanibacter sp. LJY008]|uniref:dTDP-4-dehydrorhamnose 3,5-epimerase n=1 Tax=Limnobaculum eriocheiris TaxID=2897391 RepID=A0A9X1MUJ8_9GAMM|nr:dTDP-4-dehydrorhamnose 3,5-epimerase [Limnobaculum eriocheiris]MCD1124783.1 dTDP-4-dehydrorhamnose 3,5-epimerase [Limnobaculum eriocheiris]
MNVIETGIDGLLIIIPKVFEDSRGFFYEKYQLERYKDIGIESEFVQDNRSRSSCNVLRGLHFQKTKPQGKLITVTQGVVFDVAVDLRVESDTFGKHKSVILSESNHIQFYIPPGFAHGFCVLSELADFEYKCTDYYDPLDEGGIYWSDPTLNIDWPLLKPIISDKDSILPMFRDIFS